ncbi:hypothetical protein CVIRNUC_010353 [Coccomyxa viridis]|uniref:Uncharacterized protein n=1 Tax=Coccomyxa viridis TaxID=1274662 RepID=A0AAV1ILN9_9CHLO|nr:hypothetical protein CVIRNUC_010353 [Coccomyxa viridis]
MVELEYDETGPQPHRCNARVEDFIQSLYTMEMGAKMYPAWRVMWRCVFSASGEEPREPYIMFADPKPYLVRRKKKAPWEKVEERLKRG